MWTRNRVNPHQHRSIRTDHCFYYEPCITWETMTIQWLILNRIMDNPAFADGMPDICTALLRRNRIPGSSHRQGFSATRAGHVSTLFQPSDHVGIAELRVGEDNETCMYMYICRNKFSTRTPPLLPNLSYAPSLGERGFGHFCDHGVNDISGSYSGHLFTTNLLLFQGCEILGLAINSDKTK